MSGNVLASNLKALMKAHEPPLSGRALGIAAKIDPKTVTRILAEQHSPTIDTISALASVFDLLPWQMLVPELDPADPPVTQLSRTETALYRTLQRAATDFGELKNER